MLGIISYINGVEPHPKSLSRDTWTQNWTEDFKNNIPTGSEKGIC